MISSCIFQRRFYRVFPTGNLGSKGQFGWGGAATTNVIIDPEEDMVSIFITQFMGGDIDVIGKFQTLVYQSIIE